MYELVYDYCSPEGDTEENIVEVFNGTWSELQDTIKSMRKLGYYNISATFIGYDEEVSDE